MLISQFAQQNGGTNNRSSFTTFSFTVTEAQDIYPVGTVVNVIVFTGDYTSKKGNKYAKGDYIVIPV